MRTVACWLVVLVTGFLVDFALAQSREGAYFCVEEFAGGVAYQEGSKRWEGSTFRVEGKFVLRAKFVKTWLYKGGLSEENITDYKMTITEFGTNRVRDCERVGAGERDLVSANEKGFFVCRSILTEYRVNLTTNRFLAIYAIGYVDGDDKGSDTPAITGGTCTKIE